MSSEMEKRMSMKRKMRIEEEEGSEMQESMVDPHLLDLLNTSSGATVPRERLQCEHPKPTRARIGVPINDDDAHDSYNEYLVTVVAKGTDLSVDIVEKFQKWAKHAMKAAYIVMERGGTVGNLHCHGVVKVATANAASVTKMIKKDVKCEGKPMQVCTKSLKGGDYHTFVGMLGYVQKDRNLPHWQVGMAARHSGR